MPVRGGCLPTSTRLCFPGIESSVSRCAFLSLPLAFIIDDLSGHFQRPDATPFLPQGFPALPLLLLLSFQVGSKKGGFLFYFFFFCIVLIPLFGRAWLHSCWFVAVRLNRPASAFSSRQGNLVQRVNAGQSIQCPSKRASSHDTQTDPGCGSPPPP